MLPLEAFAPAGSAYILSLLYQVPAKLSGDEKLIFLNSH